MICPKLALSSRPVPLLRRVNRSSASALRCTAAMSSSTSVAAVATPFEHIVLIKARPDQAAATAMVSALKALATEVPGLAYIHAGPVLRFGSPAATALGPTHILHSRYASKSDLDAYAAHPAHVAAVQAHVAPVALDATAVDWVNAAPIASHVAPGSAVRLTLVKLKEGVEPAQVVETVTAATNRADEVLGANKVSFGLSFGENFSPERAKGYQFGMVAMFDSVEDLDAVEGNDKVLEARAGVRALLADVLVLDYVVGPAAAADASS